MGTLIELSTHFTEWTHETQNNFIFPLSLSHLYENIYSQSVSFYKVEADSNSSTYPL